jgi:hypothetical protein
VNFAIRREFPIHDRLHLQFRAEAFNLFNQTSFSGVGNNWTCGPYNPQHFYGFGGASGTLNTTLGGFASPGVTIYLPLGPTVCLAMTDPADLLVGQPFSS